MLCFRGSVLHRVFPLPGPEVGKGAMGGNGVPSVFAGKLLARENMGLTGLSGALGPLPASRKAGETKVARPARVPPCVLPHRVCADHSRYSAASPKAESGCTTHTLPDCQDCLIAAIRLPHSHCQITRFGLVPHRLRRCVIHRKGR